MVDATSGTTSRGSADGPSSLTAIVVKWMELSALDNGAELRQVEAVLLASALVCELSRALGIRALLVKGFGLDAHGLRSGYVPADVDVLVENSHFDELTRALAALGWRARAASTRARLSAAHSLTLVNDAWPVDLDVHRWFPGLLAGPDASFELLWAERQPVSLAGTRCWIPDRESSIVLWALHSVRGSSQASRHTAELRALVSRVLPSLSTDARRRLGTRIVDLGADLPLAGVEEFAAMVDGREGPHLRPSRLAWASAVDQANGASAWPQILRDARMVDRPRLLLRALWPSRSDLILDGMITGDTVGARTSARLARLMDRAWAAMSRKRRR